MNRRLILALAPAALALATVAYAQAPAPGPAPGPGMKRVMMHGAPSAEMKAMHEAMMKQHVEDLKTVLRLRPDQEAALTAFLASRHGGPGMREMRRGPGGHGDHDGQPRAKTTPERLDEMAKRDAAMAAEHETSRAALAKFYAALSTDQQKTFDALQRLQGPRGGHGGGMGGPGMRRIIIRGGPGGPMPGHEP